MNSIVCCVLNDVWWVMGDVFLKCNMCCDVVIPPGSCNEWYCLLCVLKSVMYFCDVTPPGSWHWMVLCAVCCMLCDICFRRCDMCCDGVTPVCCVICYLFWEVWCMFCDFTPPGCCPWMVLWTWVRWRRAVLHRYWGDTEQYTDTHTLYTVMYAVPCILYIIQ